MKKKLFTFLLLSLLILSFAMPIFASSPTDEIKNYEITVIVNDDASASLTYHFDWLVLESDGIGPVEWVSIGVPSGYVKDLLPLSDNISRISTEYGSDYTVRIDFKKKYYEGETISFDFSLLATNLYEMNAVTSNETRYEFTPGWFDEIKVDKLTIKWSADKATAWSQGGLLKDGYLTWQTSLDAGDVYSIYVGYPNDAYKFTDDGQISYNPGQSGYYESSSGFDIFAVGFSLIWFFSVFTIIRSVIKRARMQYEEGSGFADGKTTKKVTRTKVVYYDTCPNCGAPKEDGKEACEYCGTSLIKSEEILEEDEIKDEDKEAMKYSENGTYHYSSNPNTFVRVNVVHVPIFRPSPASFGGGRRTGGGGRPSCAHSSCACASCACACACACAGGGRAGCSTKDFYKTDLKLTQFEKAKKKN